MAEGSTTSIRNLNDDKCATQDDRFQTRDNLEITTLEDAKNETGWRAMCLAKFLQIGANKSSLITPETRTSFWRINTSYNDWKVVEKEGWLDAIVAVLCNDKYPETAYKYLLYLLEKPDETNDDGWYKMTRNVLLSLMNFSSASNAFQLVLGSTGIVKLLVKSCALYREKQKNLITDDILRGLVAILMNLSTCINLKQSMTSDGVNAEMELLMKYECSKTENKDYVTCAALVTLAHLLQDSSEAATWAVQSGFMAPLLEKLKLSLAADGYRWRGISADVMAEGVWLLAINQLNAKKLIELDVISVVGLLLNSERASHRLTGVRLLSALCQTGPDVRKLVKTEKRDVCIVPLESFKAFPKELVYQKEAVLLLDFLAAIDEGKTEKEDAIAKTDYQYDIFVSYCWDDKDKIEFVVDELRNQGLRVWWDKNNLHGSLLQSMHDGIIASRCIVMFVSLSYWRSNACRMEAEFAFQMKKTRIPISVYADFKPEGCGWLLMLLATVRYYNFAADSRALADKVAEIKMLALDSQPSSEQSIGSKKLTFESWSAADLQSWLGKENLSHFGIKFENFSGRHLAMLYKMFKASPTSYFEVIEKLHKEAPLHEQLVLLDSLDRLFHQF